MIVNFSVPSDEQKIYTVSELNRETGWLLNSHFLSILVEGEISNLSIPASGHCYFTLKDANAQVRCAMFRSQRRNSATPENGKQVVVKAQVSLYEPRGDYQLIVDYFEEAGAGVLRRAFDALKLKLSAEGLFADEFKKPLPGLPRTIGVITSPTGAAIRDILTVLGRRFPAIPVIVYPAAAQGENAKYEICRAIATANRLKQCDVLILARGGGSLEDLWAYNEEIVARAIFASAIPLISGIGHETDVTIADFVADLRAATPSAAAEHASPDQQQWLNYLANLEARFTQHQQRIIQQQQQKLAWLDGRLQQQHPSRKLTRNQQRVDELEQRLTKGLALKMLQAGNRLQNCTIRLAQFSPLTEINQRKLKYGYLNDRLNTAIQNRLRQYGRHLSAVGQTLHAVSPLATLNRGYAIVTDPATGQVVRSAKQLTEGQTILARLNEGRFSGIVSRILDD